MKREHQGLLITALIGTIAILAPIAMFFSLGWEPTVPATPDNHVVSLDSSLASTLSELDNDGTTVPPDIYISMSGISRVFKFRALNESLDDRDLRAILGVDALYLDNGTSRLFYLYQTTSIPAVWLVYKHNSTSRWYASVSPTTTMTSAELASTIRFFLALSA